MLAQQITGVNSQLQASSYLQQGTALAAQGTAATAAGTAANDNAASLNALGTAAKTNAVNEAAALNVNIPGLANLSGTSIPTVNPVTIGNQDNQPGRRHGAEQHPLDATRDALNGADQGILRH